MVFLVKFYIKDLTNKNYDNTRKIFIILDSIYRNRRFFITMVYGMKIMKLWKWKDGRQSSCVYKKLPLYFFKIWRFGFDCYILKYEANQLLKPHTDPIGNAKHYRINIGWGKAIFTCDDLILGVKLGKFSIYIFRPDTSLHALYVVDKTTKISFGFAKFNN